MTLAGLDNPLRKGAYRDILHIILSWSRQVSLVNEFPRMGHNLLSVTDSPAMFKLGFFCDNTHDDSLLISKPDVIVPSVGINKICSKVYRSCFFKIM